MITIPDSKCAVGVTYGSVIRYDPEANFNTGLYKLSTANNIQSSEVVGIVESINTDNSKNVVIYGSINLPNSSIENAIVGSSGGSGGADIYFLSSTTSGKLNNLPPTELTHVVKPIYQTAPHGNGSYTGVVMNYIGYKIDGADFSSPQANVVNNFVGNTNIIDPDSNSGVGLIKFMLVDTELGYQIPETFVDMTISHILPQTEYPDYFNIFNYYDFVYTFGNPVSNLSPPSRLFIEYCVCDSTHIVNSANIGKFIFKQNDVAYFVKIIDFDPVNNAYILSHNMSSLTANVTRTSTEQPTFNYGISNTAANPLSVAGFFRFNTVTPYGFHTPIIKFNNTIFDSYGNNTATTSNYKVIPLLKVKKDIQGGASLVENNQFDVDTLLINNENINFILENLENRLQEVETRLLIT